ncbi:hypothetical protein [Hansschlegelia zhihuaiae]|uniref:hypothetical protein n=1 Tax=Hansschlegelia zhihuaiae TaxID=405005 RepID=UPI001FE1D905|nr:hypothetical protein [Hansschlegelia zhihuaiae]
MVDPARKLMTVEEFFAWEETQEESHELVDGVPVLRGEWIRYGDQWTLMSGASQRHDQIVVNMRGCGIGFEDSAAGRSRPTCRFAPRPAASVGLTLASIAVRAGTVRPKQANPRL